MWDENKVRIVDIARELGLSTATVSNVLHGKTKKISDATVKRVESKLEETGYIPNMAATLLARNNSRIIGVVVNDHEKYEGHVFEDPFISASINALSDSIEGHGYFIMLKKTKDIRDIIRFSTMWNIDGLVVIGFCEEDYHNLREYMRVPFVVYDGYMDEHSRISDIRIDDYDGGRKVGEHLKKLGHKKVLCIADNKVCMDMDRYNGLCDGLDRKADFLMIPMEKTKRKLFYDEKLKIITGYTAVFAVSDYYAIELMRFLSDNGIRIPEDISVAGFDGSRDSLMSVPSLTSVYQNNEARAQMAMELLMKMIGDASFYRSVCIPVKLVVRDSTGKARQIQ